MSARMWERIVIDGEVWPYEVHRDAHRVRRQAGSVARGGHVYRVRGGVLTTSTGRYTLSQGRGHRVHFRPRDYLSRGGAS